MPYATWCWSCVAGKGKVHGYFLSASDGSGVKGVAFDIWFVGDSVESGAVNERCLPVSAHNFYRYRVVTATVVP